MFKKYYYYLFLFSLGCILFYNPDYKLIIVGIALFLIGMNFTEDGFRLFSGGLLEKVIHLSTKSLPKSIFSGFLATSFMQSSSLASIIVISFLSAELITLNGALGVMLGSNIGSTTTAWIVSYFGLKLDIASFSMPMLIFGVALSFAKERGLQGFGKVLLGLGFIFLGIAYAKDGFVHLQESFDLSSISSFGYFGSFLYVLLGIMIAALLRSSGASMALIITALATGQILYISAIWLTVGANIGRSVTTIIGALSSTSDGKRVALAHLVFNLIAAFFVTMFFVQILSFVDFTAQKVGFLEDESIKIALFHTTFNLIGVTLFVPFMPLFITYLNKCFIKIQKSENEPIYLEEVSLHIPEAAIQALRKEIKRLFEISLESISNAIFLNIDEIKDEKNLQNLIAKSKIMSSYSIEEAYHKKIKPLYSEIIFFATLSQENMSKVDLKHVYDLKLAAREIIEAIKNMRELQKNIKVFSKSKNAHIKQEYNNIRLDIARALNAVIEMVKHEGDDIDVLSSIELLKESFAGLTSVKDSRVDLLIRENRIDSRMATSLMNDSLFAHNVTQKLLQAATIIWIEDKNLRSLGEENEDR